MTLIVGLGNPGSKYEKNRHNVGFMVVDELINHLNATDISKSKFNGLLYKSNSFLLLKPTTFMNDSGQSVQNVINYYDIEQVVVIHDELDIPFGSVKFKVAGGNGGHNGLKSIDAHLKQKYFKIRVGIDKPSDKSQVSNYVLKDFSKQEFECLPMILEHCKNACLKLNKKSFKDISSIFSVKGTSKKICQDSK
jgi:PTH1 family peptidyl-tRNA hydrolase